MSKVTVIIPSLVSVDRKYLKLCVESLRATVDWDIIVVANGTKDMNPLADTPIKGITKLLITRQQGQCNAVNRGADVVEGNTRWLLVSNADMFYAPGWNRHLPDLDSEDTPLCFSPNLIEPTDNGGSAPPFLKFDGGLTLEAFREQAVSEFVAAESAAQKPKVQSGFNLPFFIRLDVWRTIGGYDQAYDPWGSNSDTDLQTKINYAGITPKRLRDVLVYHFSQKSGTFERNDPAKDEAWWRNWRYYENKWGFNRDQLGSDVWMNKKMLPKDRDTIKFDAEWEGKYSV